MPARRLSGDWVLPGDRAPIAHGAILLDEGGRVARVGPHAEVPSPPGILSERFPGAVLLPGLVNAHTHLELTGLPPIPEADFPSWIREVIAQKALRSAAEFLEAARRGIQGCWQGGVTTIADTGDSGAVIQALAELEGSGVAYHEVFGPDPRLAGAQVEAFTRRLAELEPFAGKRVHLGVSPHAPYSVSGALYQMVAELASRRALPMAVHLAESVAEVELLQGTGGFAEAWRKREIPVPRTSDSPTEWLDRAGVLTPRTLCIHMVQASSTDLDLVARRGAAIAHCPRSNARHGHGTAPLGAMLTRGIRVGVGTDSVASVAPLDLMAEARAARRVGGLDARAALALITSGAAEAIGLGAEVGTLTEGKWGDVAVIRLPEPAPGDSVNEATLDTTPGHVQATYVGGRPVCRNGSESR